MGPLHAAFYPFCAPAATPNAHPHPTHTCLQADPAPVIRIYPVTPLPLQRARTTPIPTSTGPPTGPALVLPTCPSQQSSLLDSLLSQVSDAWLLVKLFELEKLCGNIGGSVLNREPNLELCQCSYFLCLLPGCFRGCVHGQQGRRTQYKIQLTPPCAPFVTCHLSGSAPAPMDPVSQAHADKMARNEALLNRLIAEQSTAAVRALERGARNLFFGTAGGLALRFCVHVLCPGHASTSGAAMGAAPGLRVCAWSAAREHASHWLRNPAAALTAGWVHGCVRAIRRRARPLRWMTWGWRLAGVQCAPLHAAQSHGSMKLGPWMEQLGCETLGLRCQTILTQNFQPSDFGDVLPGLASGHCLLCGGLLCCVLLPCCILAGRLHHGRCLCCTTLLQVQPD